MLKLFKIDNCKLFAAEIAIINCNQLVCFDELTNLTDVLKTFHFL